MNGDFRIGEWLIQPQLNTISLNNDVIRVEPKVMEVLVYLAGHAGEVVSKESLIEAVWADTFVTDGVLTNSIWELRRAFGDEAKNPRFIQTVPKKGYRLIANVSIEETKPAETEQGSAGGETRAQALRWKPAAAALL